MNDLALFLACLMPAALGTTAVFAIIDIWKTFRKSDKR